MNTNIYEDISKRTNGDIYIGVVGPVRTGKSTFIKKFMELLVLPRIDKEYDRERTRDELPQSGDGKTIMTVEPKFVPNNGVEVKVKDKLRMKIKMVDCVGYLVEGALGHEEEGKQRKVSTPWKQEPIPFEEAAEIGTQKVIKDHSTIGIVITTDGSITGISRKSYLQAEERVIKELTELNKPFAIVLNTKNKDSEETLMLKNELEEKYNMRVLPLDVLNMDERDIENIMENVLYDFPLREININLPSWVEGLERNHWIKSSIMRTIKENLNNIRKIKDVDNIVESFNQVEFLEKTYINDVNLGEGIVEIRLEAGEELFYNIIEEKTGYKLEGQHQLLSLVSKLANVKREYDKVEKALNDVRTKGYGLVPPSLDELTLDEPEIFRHGNQFGVKLRANAPSLHLIRADIKTEVSPIVGAEKQGEELARYLLKEFEEDPSKLWESNMFGKSLHDLVKEQLQNKLFMMPEDIRNKMQKTLEKIINEGSGNLIAIIL
ncbi:stage IV sporulation protein A [Alkalithermobacter thermoalcaliphilus JW-YL-7 = DSM 7308]|uniref:Stage IV sporulation protein A n=1 Tax=Alkalithermobacter thermoalcaliphilus JW-YL-7 = DSM 7308 TaxID=1121328 RepID=A0A150FPM9_CLOPD|nr:stage IV sporulation protein A [[Clostridium] paradoxum JW-YL-7 = DSM 7308]SHK97538.1 stage IV sporulation protein A [[Clostridium] paradoxum JW-YL-7 = DSM 7308]